MGNSPEVGNGPERMRALIHRVPPDHKYGCLRTNGFWIAREVRDRGWFRIGDEVVVTLGDPFAVPEGWARSLGEIACRRFSRADITFLAVQESVRPDILDSEHDVLTEKVHLAFQAMFLVANPYHSTQHIVAGNRVHERLTVRTYSEPNPMFSNVPTTLNLADLRDVSTVFESLKSVIEPELTTHARLRRGYSALREAFIATTAPARLHYFVRAIEAVAFPKVGKIKKQIIARARHFLEGSPDRIEKVLNDLYELRSRVEHMEDYRDYFEHSEKETETEAAFVLYQAERVAKHMYARILIDRSLLDKFKTDDDIRAFWQLPQRELRQTIGTQVPVEVPEAASDWLRLILQQP